MHGASQCHAGALLRGGEVRRAALGAPSRGRVVASAGVGLGSGPGRPVSCARCGAWPAVSGGLTRRRAAPTAAAPAQQRHVASAGSDGRSGEARSSMSWQRMRHQMCGTGAQLGSGPRRDVAARAELMFDYCDVTDNDPLTSTLRSFRALALQGMRSTVTPENRVDVIQGVICLAYMLEITLWVVITAALPAMVADPNVALAAHQTGTVLACGTAGSTVGKILASLVMDSVPARSAIIFVMCTVAAGNVAFSFGSSMPWFCITWCFARVIHASGWVAATRLICSFTPQETRGAALGTLAFSARIGFTAGGALLGAMLLRGLPWQSLFWVTSAGAVLGAALLFALVPPESPFDLTAVPTDDADKSESLADGKEAEEKAPIMAVPQDASQATTRGEAVNDFVRSPQVWVAVAARCLLHVVYEFQSFVNLYAQKVLSISPGAAAQVAAGFSCGSAIAVLTGGRLFCRMTAAGRRNLCIALSLGTIAVFSALLTPGLPTYAIVGLLCCLGATVSVPYYIPLPAYNIRRGGAFSAVLEGSTETLAFGSAMVFDLQVGRLLSQPAGWNGVISTLLTFSVGAAVLVAVFMQQEKRLEDKMLAS